LRESPPLQQEKFALPARAALETPAAQHGRVNVARASVVEQVLEKMVFSREISGEAKVFIRLKPAVLGEVEISLRMEDGRLTGRILTDSVSVKEALEAALVQLRQRLEAQQIQVAELTVGVGRENPFDRGHRMPAAPWRERYGGARNQGGEALEEPVLPVILPGLVNALA
jgi:flagellar hook-length control protein FliK